MKVAIFDTHKFERDIFETQNKTLPHPHQLLFFEARLTKATTPLGKNAPAICVFVNDRVDAEVAQELSKNGVKFIALRSAGFNHVAVNECQKLGIRMARVPAYSPHAVAEHALALILTLNRKIHRAYQRTRELDFSLDGLVGFDLYEKSVGVIGTGAIGSVFAGIIHGIGCRVLAYDPFPNGDLLAKNMVQYVSLDELCSSSDVISLHVPLNEKSRHMINHDTIELMKPGVMIINTSRGALIDTKALIDGLKSEKIGSAGLDVYEEEEGIFFYDLSNFVLKDDLLARLLTFPNVLITAHQGFLTKEALQNIAHTTLSNISAWERGEPLAHELKVAL